MQKVFNALSVFSFVVSVSVVGGGAYVYTQREAIREKAIDQVTEMITGAVSGAVGDLPNLLGGGGVPAPGGGPAGTGAGGSLPIPGGALGF